MGELYFLLTFKECEFGFFITKLETPKFDWFDSEKTKIFAVKENGVFLLVEKSKDYKFQLRFEGYEYLENKGRVLKVRMESWDDVRLENY